MKVETFCHQSQSGKHQKGQNCIGLNFPPSVSDNANRDIVWVWTGSKKFYFFFQILLWLFIKGSRNQILNYGDYIWNNKKSQKNS